MPDITAIQFCEYGPPEVLSARRVAAPRPAAGEVLIDVHAASVNPVDWKVRAGLLQKVFPVAFPMTSGRDGAGVVGAVGSGVDTALIGRRVCFLAGRGVGAFAEQIVLPAALAVGIPDRLSFTDAAALPLAGLSAWAALVTAAQVGPGMRVLVHAASGGVGTLAVQIARDRGAEVAATCSRRNGGFVRELGAGDVAFHDAETPFEDRLSGLDVVLDPLGGDIHRRSYAVLRKRGMIVCLSAAPYEDRGAEYGVSVKTAQVLPDPAVLAEIVARVATGRLRPVVERVLPFSEFVASHRMCEQGHARGKTVLRIRQSSDPSK
ncbi:MAG: NADP-dependent oxidoreductase [Proteobacteria bacterium]|nr:NADP-dependent oxidoreductase [Pseudomonadota bacterium]